MENPLKNKMVKIHMNHKQKILIDIIIEENEVVVEAGKFNLQP